MASKISIKHVFQVIDDSQPNKNQKSSKPKAHLLAQMLRHCVGITFWKEHVPQQILRWGLTVSRRITSKIDAFSPISVAFGVPPISGTPSPTLLPTKSLNHFHLALRKPKSPTTNWSFQTLKKHHAPFFNISNWSPPRAATRLRWWNRWTPLDVQLTYCLNIAKP